MTAQTSLFLPATSHLLTGKIINATGAFSLAAGVPTNFVTLSLDNSATNVNWMIIRSFICTSDDTVLRNLIVGRSPDNGTTFLPLFVAPIPIGAGTINTPLPSVDLLNNAYLLGLATDTGSNRNITLPASCVLMVGSLVAVTSGKALYLQAEVDVY